MFDGFTYFAINDQGTDRQMVRATYFTVVRQIARMPGSFAVLLSDTLESVAPNFVQPVFQLFNVAVAQCAGKLFPQRLTSFKLMKNPTTASTPSGRIVVAFVRSARHFSPHLDPSAVFT